MTLLTHDVARRIQLIESQSSQILCTFSVDVYIYIYISHRFFSLARIFIRYDTFVPVTPCAHSLGSSIDFAIASPLASFLFKLSSLGFRASPSSLLIPLLPLESHYHGSSLASDSYSRHRSISGQSGFANETTYYSFLCSRDACLIFLCTNGRGGERKRARSRSRGLSTTR